MNYTVALSLLLGFVCVTALRENVGEYLKDAAPRASRGLKRRPTTASSSRDYSRLTLLSANDVYKMFGASNQMKAWVWEGTVPKETYTELVSQCKASSMACFPAEAAVTLGVVDTPLDNISFAGPDGTKVKLMKDGNLGCVKKISELRKNTPKFGHLVDYAKTLQMRKRTLLSEDPKMGVLNLLQGDFLSPSFTAKNFRGMHLLSLMNEMEMDLVAFGNHDFDHKSSCDDQLCVKQRMLQSNFMWLGANVHDTKSSAGPEGLFGGESQVPSTIEWTIEGHENRTQQRNPWVFSGEDGDHAYNRLHWHVFVQGKKVCFFGTTDAKAAKAADSKAAQQGLEFTNAHDKGLQLLKLLRGDDCAFIVALTHQVTGEDIVFWSRAVDEGVQPPDLILGGHDHYAAFLHLRHPDHEEWETRIWKMGADAQLLAEIHLRTKKGKVVPEFRLVPVLEGQCGSDKDFCRRLPQWSGCGEWAAQYSKTYEHFAAPAKELRNQTLPVVFKGLYDTANTRVHETRAANLLIDFIRAAMKADVATTAGGSIRGDLFDPKSADGDHLTALDIIEEFPFGNHGWALEITLLQLYGVVKSAITERLRGGISGARAHISGVSVTYDDDGPMQLVFEGQCHVAGLLDRTNASQGTPFPCGTELWTRTNGFGLLDPTTKFTMAGSEYGLFYGGDVLGKSADLAVVETACSKQESASSGHLQQDFGCQDGRPVAEYYTALAENSSFDCGMICETAIDGADGSECVKVTTSPVECWSLVANSTTYREVKIAGGEKISDHIIRVAKETQWKVGGESRAELLLRGVREDEFVLFPYSNLPVQRFTPAELAQKQAQYDGIVGAAEALISKGRKKWNKEDITKLEDFKVMLEDILEIKGAAAHVGVAVQRVVKSLEDLKRLGVTKKKSSKHSRKRLRRKASQAVSDAWAWNKKNYHADDKHIKKVMKSRRLSERRGLPNQARGSVRGSQRRLNMPNVAVAPAMAWRESATRAKKLSFKIEAVKQPEPDSPKARTGRERGSQRRGKATRKGSGDRGSGNRGSGGTWKAPRQTRKKAPRKTRQRPKKKKRNFYQALLELRTSAAQMCKVAVWEATRLNHHTDSRAYFEHVDERCNLPE